MARETGRAALLTVLSVVLLAGAAGFAVYDAGWLDRYLGRTGPVAPAAIPPPEGVEVPAAAPARPVLPAAGAGRAGAQAAGSVPTSRELERHLAAATGDEDLGKHLGVLVAPLSGGGELLRVGGSDSFVPASSMKLLTSAAALELMGPLRRFSTSVVRGSARSDRGNVVLVGGGDPLLTRRPGTDDSDYPEAATLRDLARKTAKELEADGVSRVRLGYDAGLFTGPAVSPQWKDSYVPDDVVSPISALWVDEGRTESGPAARADDPAFSAADVFASELERAGVDVRGRPRETSAPTDARTLARVQSAPLAQIVQHVIEISDNEGAEVLLRHAGIAAGRDGSFTGGARAVRDTMAELGVDMSGARIYDGSGLSRRNRLRTDTLVQTLQVAASPAQTDLRRVVSGLPVAGFNGSLAYRYITDGAEGRGLVRAKTGTLTGVNALVGVAVDRAGTALAFAAVADEVRPIDTLDARAALDGLTADIATCC
jgi:serine-type D-Ala-D-Ala carboxypeptidase/endopeptidase (penicillin-binding protein 4)